MLKKFCSLFLGILLLFSFSACSNRSSLAEEIEKQLFDKYGKEFTVDSIGGRSAGNSTTTAYVYANDDSTMRFVVRISDDMEIQYDEYSYRLVSRQAELLINSIFSKYGMESACYASFTPYNEFFDMNITIDKYIKNYNVRDLFISIVVRDSESVTGENIEKAYKEIHQQLNYLKIANSLFILSSDDYDRVSDKIMRETQSFDSYRISLYGTEDPIKQIILQVNNNNVSKTAYELNTELGK